MAVNKWKLSAALLGLLQLLAEKAPRAVNKRISQLKQVSSYIPGLSQVAKDPRDPHIASNRLKMNQVCLLESLSLTQHSPGL